MITQEELDKSYVIKMDSKTMVSVKGYQLFKPRWVNFFGSEESVIEFIKNY